MEQVSTRVRSMVDPSISMSNTNYCWVLCMEYAWSMYLLTKFCWTES